MISCKINKLYIFRTTALKYVIYNIFIVCFQLDLQPVRQKENKHGQIEKNHNLCSYLKCKLVNILVKSTVAFIYLCVSACFGGFFVVVKTLKTFAGVFYYT